MDEMITTIEAIHDTHELTNVEKRRITWRKASNKYYQKNKEKIIIRVLEKYHCKTME